MKKIILSMTGLMALAPAFAFAQQSSQPELLTFLQTTVPDLLNAIIPIIITVGVIFFILGVVQYVIADDEAAKTKGRDRMLYGIIGLFVIVTFWGLVTVLQNTLDVSPTAPPVIDINPSQ